MNHLSSNNQPLPPADSPSSPSTAYRLPSTVLPPRQRWDERYAVLSSKDRREPTPFVTACLPQLPKQGSALDVAAGAGRHSLALAKHGLQVDAVDISCQGLHLARQRAKAAGAPIHFIVADIERPWLPHRPYDVILISFFLHRPLFPLIKERLRPGGWLIYETLTTDRQVGLDEPMRREFLLEPGELKTAFADFEILFYDEAEHGNRATSQLLARKRPPTADRRGSFFLTTGY